MADKSIIKYDPEVHCGAMDETDPGSNKRRKPCMKLKGIGTSHPGTGMCEDHEDAGEYYEGIHKNRLSELISRTRRMEIDPSDITRELEVVRALLIAYLEDHTDLDDSQSLATTGEMIDRLVRVAQAFRKMRQEEMLHIKAVELIHMQMADITMKEVEQIDPNLVAEWRTVLVNRIKDGWGMINVPTSIRELKRLTEGEDES